MFSAISVLTYLWEEILLPLMINAFTLAFTLFLGFLVFKIPFFQKSAASIIYSVQRATEFREQTDAESGSVTDERIDNETSTTLTKTSKNYGANEKWQIRTFYLLTEAQLLSNDYIEFKVRNHPEVKIRLSAVELEERFGGLKSGMADGAGRIRVYINQSKDDDAFYIQRFGKKILLQPVKLSAEHNKMQYRLVN